ncbi:MAG: hypothetical protein EHM88_07895, partial [Candidatus Rokuibacteriota bacterium]
MSRFRLRRQALALTLAVIAVAAPATPDVGLATPISAPAAQMLELPPPTATAKHPKLDSHLVDIAAAADTGGTSAGMRVAAEHSVTASDGDVRVVVTAKGSRSAVADAIRAAGGQVDAEYANLVQAFVPINRLTELAGLPS